MIIVVVVVVVVVVVDDSQDSGVLFAFYYKGLLHNRITLPNILFSGLLIRA